MRAGRAAYFAFTGGVNVATGLVDASGRQSIVTAPGAGMEPTVETYLFDIYTANCGRQTGASTVAVFASGSRLTGSPAMYVMPAGDMSMDATFTRAVQFDAFPGSTSGVDVATSANPKSADLVVSGIHAGRSALTVFDVHATTKTAKQWNARTLYTAALPRTISGLGGQ